MPIKPYAPEDYFLIINILSLKDWKPLSRTRKFDALWANITHEEEVDLRKKFGVFLAKMLAEQAQKAIRSQRFPVKYKPLNKDYKAWKESAGRKTGFWQSSEFLCNHIKAWFNKSSGEVQIGFPPRLKHPDNGEYVAEIARTLEMGTKDKKIPPRPLFTPLARNIEKSVSPIFIRFMRTQDKRYLKFVE